MPSASIAEWIVARFTSEKRATSIVGDLLELKPEKGPLWFWLAASGVVLALVWRRPLAFIAAFYAGAWAIGGFQMTTVGIHAQHRPPECSWMPVFMVLSAAATILLFLLVYAAIRYGFRDQVTQLALALTGLATTVIYYRWQPAVLVACIVLSISSVVASILSGERRRAALVLLVVVVGFGGGLLAMYLASQYQHFVILPG
jgi:hypothetical protein